MFEMMNQLILPCACATLLLPLFMSVSGWDAKVYTKQFCSGTGKPITDESCLDMASGGLRALRTSTEKICVFMESQCSIDQNDWGWCQANSCCNLGADFENFTSIDTCPSDSDQGRALDTIMVRNEVP
nr:PREDICTED: uncharacterized protein LOC109032521 [Bemisia tabaci]